MIQNSTPKEPCIVLGQKKFERWKKDLGIIDDIDQFEYYGMKICKEKALQDIT